MFASAFPLSALLALLNNLVEIRSDANKLLVIYKRVPYCTSQVSDNGTRGFERGVLSADISVSLGYDCVGHW